MPTSRALLCFVVLAAASAHAWPPPMMVQRPVRRDLLVAAAASLSGVAPQLTHAFHEASGIDLRFNFGGSNTLARQIVEGARVDAFVSADAAQMDLVERSGRLVEGTRVSVVSNRLVVIVGSSPNPLTFTVDDLASPATRRVAMGDPAAVPAGVYGRRWLEAIRLWNMVEPKVVPLPSSPAVVAAVGAGRAELGVVYASDVHSRERRPRRVPRAGRRCAGHFVSGRGNYRRPNPTGPTVHRLSAQRPGAAHLRICRVSSGRNPLIHVGCSGDCRFYRPDGPPGDARGVAAGGGAWLAARTEAVCRPVDRRDAVHAAAGDAAGRHGLTVAAICSAAAVRLARRSMRRDWTSSSPGRRWSWRWRS